VDRAQAIELQRGSLEAFVRVLGTASERSAVVERDGVVAAVVPATPERSVLNSVTYRDAGSLGAAIDELARAYEGAGVRAWTVWVPEGDRDATAALEEAGHHLDGTPTAMTLDLARLEAPDRDDLDWDAEAPTEVVARINDLAYGYELGTFGSALQRLPAGLSVRLYQARVDGEAASVLGTVDSGEDCGIYFVATLQERRGRGLARELLHVALAEARERGMRTSSLQATSFGFPVYERLGYETTFALEMWERRK
jgi:GNAT superfamily N-acetyltransferase